MPATRRRHNCGHKGYGKNFCHRCQQADLLEEKAKALPASQAPQEGEKKGKGKKVLSEGAQALLEEAKRLRSASVRRTSFDDPPETKTEG